MREHVRTGGTIDLAHILRPVEGLLTAVGRESTLCLWQQSDTTVTGHGHAPVSVEDCEPHRLRAEWLLQLLTGIIKRARLYQLPDTNKAVHDVLR